MHSGGAVGGRGAAPRRLSDTEPGGDDEVLVEAGSVLLENDGTYHVQ